MAPQTKHYDAKPKSMIASSASAWTDDLWDNRHQLVDLGLQSVSVCCSCTHTPHPSSHAAALAGRGTPQLWRRVQAGGIFSSTAQCSLGRYILVESQVLAFLGQCMSCELNSTSELISASALAGFLRLEAGGWEAQEEQGCAEGSSGTALQPDCFRCIQFLERLHTAAHQSETHPEHSAAATQALHDTGRFHGLAGSCAAKLPSSEPPQGNFILHGEGYIAVKTPSNCHWQ